MALPSYKSLLDDPKFQSASVDEQNQLNDKYWSLYDKENPGDPWAQQMRTATYGLFGTKKDLQSAPPIKQRELDLQRDAFNFSVNLGVADKEGMWKTPDERSQAIQQKQAEFDTKKAEIDKTMSLFRDKNVNAAMQPAWQALTSSASMGEVFEAPDTWGDTALKGVSYIASGGGSSERRDKARADYDKYRSTMATDFGLSTEEVDDLVKHRLGKQADQVSQDVSGTIHFRDDLLVKPTSEVEKAIEQSKLPDAVKSLARTEAPQKIALFKTGVLDRVKKDYPELANDMTWTGKTDEDYATLQGKLNKDWVEQFGGGVAGAALSGVLAEAGRGSEFGVRDVVFGNAPGSDVKVVRDGQGNVVRMEKAPTLDEKSAALAKKQQAINDLSSFINQDKTKIFNVDAATIGQGVYSMGESVLLGAATGGVGTALVSADRIAKAGKVGKALLGFSKGALNTAPVAGIYGAQQGFQTYEQALASDDPNVRANAANLALGSAAIEFGVTTIFGGIGLGGNEDFAQKLASPIMREAAAKSIGQAWKNLAKNLGEAVVGEVPEEALITALDSVHIQQKLNPQMTDADVRKAIYDTVVSTALTTAPLGGIKATKEGIKDFRNIPTHDRSTDELQREADDLAKASAQESLSEEAAQRRDEPSPSAERVAELGTERTQLEERLKKTPPGGQPWLDLKERILEINQLIGEPTKADEKPFTVSDIPKADEQNQLSPAGESNAPQALQLPPVPPEPKAPADVEPAGGAPQGAGTAQAQAQAPLETSPATTGTPTETLPAGQAAPSGEGAAPVAPTTPTNGQKDQMQGREVQAQGQVLINPAGETRVEPAAPLSEQPSAVLAPRSTRNVEPRPAREGRDTSKQDTWDEQYGSMRKGGRTHNDDGSAYQPTLFDEVMPKVLQAWDSAKDDSARRDIAGDDTNASVASTVRKLLNAGFVWDDNQQKLVNPNSPTETPLQARYRLNASPQQQTPQTNATNQGNQQEGNLSQHPQGNQSGETATSGGSNSAISSGQEQQAQEAFQTLTPDVIKAAAPHLSDDVASAAAALFNTIAPDIPVPVAVQGETKAPKMTQGELFQGEKNDADYLSAVESGDMETAQRMVDEAAKAAGYEKVWHGTDSSIIEGNYRPSKSGNFGPGVYFTAEESSAREFARLERGIDNAFPAYVRGNFLVLTEDQWKSVDDRVFDKSFNRDGSFDRSKNSIAWLKEQRGYDGVVIGKGANTEYVVFSPSQIKSADPVTYDSEGKPIPLSQRFNPESPSILYQEDGPQPLPEAEVPSRHATKTEEAGGLSYAELEAHPTALRKIVNKLRTHKVFRVGPGNVKQAAKRIMDQMVSNILKIHDMVPEDIRNQSKLWYSGANAISHRWSQQFGVSTQAVAGAIAAMSPQKDWFQNVSLAERLLSIWTGQGRETDTFNEDMRDAAKKMDAAQAKAAAGKGYLTVDGEEVPLFAHEARLNKLIGKKFDELEDADVAFFIRLYDSTYNNPSYALISPDGRFGKFHENKNGSPTRIAWGSNHEVTKAVRILNDPSVANISEQLGKAHKIRSFYNNIVNPDSGETVTSDTHAVAVAYLLPLSGSSMEVSHNFGGTGSGSFKGTYAFIAEAYRRAAAARDIKPSQMQSITWEAIREIFTAASKRNESTVAKIRKLWEDYSRGKTDKSYDETANEAIAAGGGYAFPAWYRQSELGFGDSGTAFDRGSTFTSKRGGAGADGLRTGTGRGDGRGSQSARPGSQGGAEQGTLFQAEQPQRPRVTRGSITFAADMGKAWITLMQHANASTFPHELAHFLRRFVLADNADARMAAERRGISVEEIQNLAKWAGVGADGVWTRVAEEKFARGFERYLADGNAPTPQLQALFDKFAAWLKEIYGAITGSAIDIKISPEARAVFDKLLAGPAPATKPAPAAKPAAKPAPAPATKQPTTPTDEFSAKREYMDALRRKYGFAPYYPGDPVTDQMVTDEAAQALDNVRNGRPSKYKVGQDLVNELEGRSEPADAVEIALLVHEAKVLDTKLTRAYAGIEGASNERQSNSLSASIAEMEEQLNVIATIVSERGTAAGRMLQSFKKVWDNKFDLVRMTAAYLRDKRAATGDSKATVNPDERKKIREINTKLKEKKKAADDAVAAREKEVRAKQAKAVVDALAKDVRDKKAPAKQRVRDQLRAAFDVKSAAERLRARGFGARLEQSDAVSDKDYLAAIEAGDMETAQRMVDEAARKAGARRTKWMHGTPDIFAERVIADRNIKSFGSGAEKISGGLTTESDVVWFTPDTSVARQYAEGVESRRAADPEKGIISYVDIPDGIKTIDYNQELSAEEARILREMNPYKYKVIDENTTLGTAVVWRMNGKFPVGVVLKALGYDGMTLGPKQLAIPKDAVPIVAHERKGVLSPAGKLPDPVTYDSEGNVIPLSQRFNPQSPSILYQSELAPEILDDLATVGAGLILDHKLENLDDFTAAVVHEFGPEAMDYAQEIYQRSQDKIEAARKSRKIPKSPEQLLKEVDPEKELSNRMVFNMVRGYLLQGMDKDQVLRQVHKDLQSVWEEITFEEVSDAFTGYGKIKYPSTEEINVQLRQLRNVERIKRQLDVVRSKQVPSKTGFQRDKPTPEIRALQKELKAAMKAAGIKTTRSNQLKSSLDAIKTRFRNELEDLQRAIDTRTALPPKKDKEEYDKETTDLKAKVDAKRAEYAAIFENKSLTEKQQLAQALAAINRSIAEEEDMLAKGILNKPKRDKRVFDDPEFKAAEARLTALREARHTAQRALKPKKSAEQIALEAAIREARKGITRDEERVRTGNVDPVERKQRYTPNDELKDLLTERASLKEIIKLQRQQKARLGKPARDAARQEQRAAEAIERSMEKIEKRIEELASGVVTPVRRILPFTTPGLSAARAVRDSRRRTMQAMEKALKVTKSAAQLREERQIKAANAKKLRYQEMIDKGILTKPVRVSAPVTEAVDKARYEAALVEAEWNKLRSKMLWENRTIPSKVWSRLKTGLRATGVLRLGGDLGLLRQGGVWALSNFWLHPFKTASTLARVARHGMTERGAYEIYQASQEALNTAGFTEKDIRLLNPIEPPGTGGRSRAAEEITGADILDMAAKLPKKTVIGLAARGLRAVEFFNTSILNIARTETALALRGSLDLPMSDNVRKAISIAAEVSSGRGNVSSEKIEAAIPFLNDWVFISARWTISRVQMFFGYPLWSTKMSFETRAKIFHEVYLKTLIGRAAMASAIAALFPPKDDEDLEEFLKRVRVSMGFGNPLDPNYGKLKLKSGFSLDLAQGVSPLAGVFARVTTGRTIRDGKTVDLRDEEKGRAVDAYLKNRANMVTASLIRTLVTGRAYGGERLPSISRIYRTLEGTEEYPVNGPMLGETAKEWFAPIILADTKRIYQEFGPKGVVLWTTMMSGAGVQAFKPKEKKVSIY